MAAVIQTPLLHGSDAIELSGGTWRKRVLPVGEVEYQGRMLQFDRDYLQRLAESFNRRAYDQVPFQIADDTNRHTNDPERYRGEVRQMSVRDDGLYVTITTTEAGNALLQANPRLGVSARIVEEYARSDGNFYPAAIQHVLGTLDPRIPQLGEWEPVDMSNGYAQDAEMVIDLSVCEWNGEPAYDPYDFAASAAHPLSPGLRKLSRTLAARHPDLGAADHVADAADAMDMGNHDGAKRHLRAAIGNFTPQSLTRHGLLTDEQHDVAKRSMDAVHRHLLLVQQDQDEQDHAEQATDRQPDVKARRDVTQPVPTGSQRMGTYANDYGGGAAVQMAEMNRAVELAYAQAARREAEDAARPVRRRTGTGITEDRLQAALGRISRGTYMPTQAQRNLGFAGDGGGTAYGAGCSCGATRDDGTTASRYHTAGCEMAMSGDEQAEYGRSVYDEISAEPFEDANGTVWGDQHGYAMTLADHLEALTGQRVAREPFNGLDRPELSMPQRPYDEGIRALAAELGLGDHRAAREEARNRAFDRLVQRPTPRYRTYGEAMDHIESTRERAERFRQPFGAGLVPTGWNDGNKLPGELVGLTRVTEQEAGQWPGTW